MAGLVAGLSGCLAYLASTVWSGSWSLVRRGQKRGYPGLCQALLNFKSSKCESWEDAINLWQGAGQLHVGKAREREKGN